MENLDFTAMGSDAKAHREERSALMHAILRADLLKDAKRREGATPGDIGRVGQEILALMRILRRLEAI